MRGALNFMRFCKNAFYGFLLKNFQTEKTIDIVLFLLFFLLFFQNFKVAKAF